MIQEIITMIDAKHGEIVGLSMGANTTMQTFRNKLDKFAYIDK